jgi:hypothetical protein
VSAVLDHLVVAAHTLQQGAEWCERALGGLPAAARQALDLQGIAAVDSPALRAVLDTPRGRVVLSSDD